MDREEKLIEIEGRLVGLVGLDELFEEFSSRDLSDAESIKEELLERAGRENPIPPGRRETYRDAIFRELARFLERRAGDEQHERLRMTWRGIRRDLVLWYPTVDETACNGCKECLAFCSFGVFSYCREKNTVLISDRFACVVGCSLCGSVCEMQAISFPPLSYLDEITRRHA